MDSKWEPRPTPKVTPETKEFWRAASNERLLLMECRDCSTLYYYPRKFCPDCFSDDTDWVEASGEGEIYSYSVMHNRRGWPQDALPLIVAYVELDEGPRIVTDIVQTGPNDIDIGDEVEAVFIPTEEEDISVPVFMPV